MRGGRGPGRGYSLAVGALVAAALSLWFAVFVGDNWAKSTVHDPSSTPPQTWAQELGIFSFCTTYATVGTFGCVKIDRLCSGAVVTNLTSANCDDIKAARGLVLAAASLAAAAMLLVLLPLVRCGSAAARSRLARAVTVAAACVSAVLAFAAVGVFLRAARSDTIDMTAGPATYYALSAAVACLGIATVAAMRKQPQADEPLL